MREILFKAKRLDNGEWVEGFYQVRKDVFENDEHLIFRGESYHTWEYAKIDPATICQYTGLTDKNGKKIWENDVVVCKKPIESNHIDYCVEIGFVEMKHGAFGLHRKRGYYRPFKDWLEDYEYEVIGNVFDGERFAYECEESAKNLF